MQRVNDWAREEIDKIVYAGTRPISVCSAVEVATREAAIAWGNFAGACCAHCRNQVDRELRERLHEGGP